MNEPHYPINLFCVAEDGCWIADVPDLKPCPAHGETRSEALARIDDAIRGWIGSVVERGFAIPDPRYCPAIYAPG